MRRVKTKAVKSECNKPLSLFLIYARATPFTELWVSVSGAKMHGFRKNVSSGLKLFLGEQMRMLPCVWRPIARRVEIWAGSFLPDFMAYVALIWFIAKNWNAHFDVVKCFLDRRWNGQIYAQLQAMVKFLFYRFWQRLWVSSKDLKVLLVPFRINREKYLLIVLTICPNDTSFKTNIVFYIPCFMNILYVMRKKCLPYSVFYGFRDMWLLFLINFISNSMSLHFNKAISDIP